MPGGGKRQAVVKGTEADEPAPASEKGRKSTTSTPRDVVVKGEVEGGGEEGGEGAGSGGQEQPKGMPKHKVRPAHQFDRQDCRCQPMPSPRENRDSRTHSNVWAEDSARCPTVFHTVDYKEIS